jgi:DNA-binding LacI/PurR family transcriptional regulator
MSRCTLTVVARAAGVSVATASLALRNQPKIPMETAARVRRAAAELGYQPHPSVSALMAHIRAGRRPGSREKIAFVWVEAGRADATQPFNRDTLAGARARARQLGYEFEEFWLSDAGMTPRRLSGILRARGIAGLVFSGCERRTGVQLDIDWPAFAPAVVGNAPWSPELHSAGYHHFMAMERVLAELKRRGYRRPALLLDKLVNDRTKRACEAAFVIHHPAPSRAARGIWKLGAVPSRTALLAWLRGLRADAVIASRCAYLAALRGARPSRLGLASLDLPEGEQTLCGIHPDHCLIAAHAVDLVVGQLLRNERGVPAEPQRLLFEGHWIEGSTLRPVVVADKKT